MAIKPECSPITIAGNPFYVSDVKLEFLTEECYRNEFDHEKLRQAKENVSGAKATLVPSFAGNVTQVGYTCTPIRPRPVTPNDIDMPNIRHRWNINRWTLTGCPTLASSVNTLLAVSTTHQQLLWVYTDRLGIINSEDVSIEYLLAAQNDSLLFLQNTGVNMSGYVLGPGSSVYSNILITKAEIIAEYESLTNPGLVYFTWTATIDQRTYV